MRGPDPRIHLFVKKDGLRQNSGLPEFCITSDASRVNPTCGVKPGNDTRGYIRTCRGDPAAAARRHFGHKQASPASGIGSRTGSAAHQQSPPGVQSKAVPQR
jgi:hypothetical protein